MSDELKAAIRSMKSSALGDDLKSSVLAKVARGPDAAYMTLAPGLRLTQKGKNWHALCPFPGHEDTKASFAVLHHGGFQCMGCNRSGDVFTFAHMMSGGDGKPRGRFPEALKAVAAKLHVSTVGASLTHSALEAFNYPDINGKIHYRKIRCADGEKRWQRREGDKWVFGRDEWKLTQGKGLLYRQDLLTGASKVVICEGESDADEMRTLGFVTTCLPDGASSGTLGRKWRPEFEEALSGLDLILVGDVDEAGENYSSDIAREMWSVAKRVKIVRLAEIGDVQDGFDCCDYIDKHGPEAMTALVNETPYLEEMPGDAISERYARRVRDVAADDMRSVEELASCINDLTSPVLQDKLLAELKSRTGIGIAQLRKARHIDPHGPFRFFRKGESGRRTFCPPLLGRELLENLELDYCFRSGELMLFDGGVWKGIDKDYLSGFVKNLLENEFKDNHAHEVWAYLKAEFGQRKGQFEISPAGYVNFKNGLLDLETWKLETHRPEVQSVNQLPIDYNAEAELTVPFDQKSVKGPCLESLLAHALDTEADRALIQEIFGYAIASCQYAKRAFIFVGPGDTGKSTLLRILGHLIGSENMSAVPIQKMADRFTTVEQYRKLVNISADLPAGAIEDTSVFKQLTGGDKLHGEIKFGKQFHFHSPATPIFSCNELPYSLDRSQAFFDRWIIMGFDKVVPKGEQIGDYDEIVWRNESEAVAAWAVEGLKRLVGRGWKFDETQNVKGMRSDYRKHSDSVYAFIEDWCERVHEASEVKAELFEAYSVYCCSERIKRPLTRRRFTKRMQEDFGLSECWKGQQRAFAGIQILSESHRQIREASDSYGS